MNQSGLAFVFFVTCYEFKPTFRPVILDVRPSFFPHLMTDKVYDHRLSFVTDTSGMYVAVHADLRGISLLINELQHLKEQLELDDCPHTHLFAGSAECRELTTTKLVDQPNEVNVVHHVKIYGWNDEWAQRHGLK